MAGGGALTVFAWRRVAVHVSVNFFSPFFVGIGGTGGSVSFCYGRDVGMRRDEAGVRSGMTGWWFGTVLVCSGWW